MFRLKILLQRKIPISAKSKTSEPPEVQKRSKELDQEIQTTSKRINNLVQSVAELPSEVPADPFYEQIKQMTLNLNDLRLVKEKLAAKEMDLKALGIDQDGLKEKIRQTLAN